MLPTLKPCTNHTFIITRPIHQAKNLSAQIENLGGKSLLFPTLNIQPLSLEGKIDLFPQIDKVIFTSANAVCSVMPHWEKIQPIPAVFAIGSGTAKALANFQIFAKTPTKAEFNSEGLLKLPELQTVKNQCIVIFSGVGGRELLLEELTKRGAKVEKIAVYRRECPALPDTFPPSENISLIISTSSESLKNLWQMAGAKGQVWLSQQPLLVISKSMATLAQELGFKCKALVANNASDEAILVAIVAWCSKYRASEKLPIDLTK